jgi:hypothetical membrane protein
MDEEYTYELDSNDRLFNAKTATIQSMNLSTALIRENKEKIYSKIFYAFSLIFAILIAMFADSLNWIFILFFINLVLLLLVWSAKRFHRRRIELARHHSFIIGRLNEFGIPVKEI